MVNYMPTDRLDPLMAWLPTVTPIEWHRVARCWYWGNGDDPLRWIAEQPNCERATAQLIFWQGDPIFYWGDTPDRIAERMADRSGGEDHFHLLGYIAARWRSHGYTRATIAWDPTDDWVAEPEHVAISAGHPTLSIPISMVQPQPGRPLPPERDYPEAQRYAEGVPPHMWHAWNEEWRSGGS